MGFPVVASAGAIRFGPFVLDLRSGELSKNGAMLRLQRQPFEVLRMLLERPGQVVTRQELRNRLWGAHTFVDFDHGINMAVAKVREALGDSPEEPRFVETLGGRGYRLVVPVHAMPEEPSALGATATAPFTVLPDEHHSVGREGDRAELEAAFQSAVAGRGLMVGVAGEPGIGKTTLVEDFLSDLHSRGAGFLLARGRCSQRLAGSEAYLPFLEALGSLLRNGGGAHREALRTVAPSWYAQLFPFSENEPSDAALQAYARTTTQERVKREFGAFVEEIARVETLVVFFDDLHWADSSTVDLLAYLATKFETTRLLVIGAYRPSELFLSNHSFIGLKRDLHARGACREIEVELLSANDVGRYVGLMFPGNAFPPEFAEVIHSRTEGNPLFMVDLVRYLRDRKALAKNEADQRWHLAQSLPDLGRVLPESARSMIERKIDQLSGREREVLSAAAAQGYDFDSAVVARALAVDCLEVEDTLEHLDRIHGFVKRVAEEELPVGTLTQRCRFVHVLYQNAIYAALTPARRVFLSAALARALEETHVDRCSAIAPQLAFLYETARNPGRASDYFLLAAQDAARLFANPEAIALAQRGLALLVKIPETAERTRKELDLQVTLAFSFLCHRGYAAPETGANMARAQELCRALGDDAQLFPVIFGLWTYYISTLDLNSCRQAARQLSVIAQDLHDPSLQLGAHAASAFTFHHHGELVASRREFEAAAGLYDVAQHGRYVRLYRLDIGIHSESEMVRTLWLLGFPDQARRRAEKALAAARALSNPLSTAFCQVFAAFLYQNLRQGELTKAIGDECIALCDEQAILLERAWVMCPHGWALAELGHVEEGIREIRAGLDMQRSVGARVAVTQFLAILAETLWRAGRTEAAEQAVQDGLAHSDEFDERYYDAELWRLKGELARLKAEPAEAESCFRNAVEIARRQAAKSLELRASTSLARLCQERGDPSEGRRFLAESYAWFTEGFDTADLREAAALLQQLSL